MATVRLSTEARVQVIASLWGRAFVIEREADGGCEVAFNLASLVGQAGDLIKVSRVAVDPASGAPTATQVWTRGVNSADELAGLVLRYS